MANKKSGMNKKWDMNNKEAGMNRESGTNKKESSITENLKVLKRCFQITNAADRGNTARLFLRLFPSVAQEYLHVFISASIIDMIISGNRWQEIIEFSIITGLVELSLFLLMHSIDRRNNCHGFTYEKNKQKMLWEKMMNMDYAHIENSETHVQLERAKKGMDMMKELIRQISFIAWGLIMLVAGLAAMLPLALRPSGNTSDFSKFIQSTWGFVAVLLLVAISELTKTLVFHKKGSAVKVECNNDQGIIQQDRIFRFYADSICGNYQNGKEIRIYKEAPLICGKIAESAGNVYHGVLEALKKLLKYMFGFYLMNILSCLLMYGFAVARAIGGTLLAGEIIAFVMYFARIQSGINQIGASLGNIGLYLDYCRNALQFLDIPDEKYKGTIPTEKRDDGEYEFEFKHVSFRYPGAEEYALKDICLKWRIGEKMALVGKNGCGKSTLVKLLCRLYDPAEGTITLNGVDIRKYKYEEYMELFSIVFQDSRLFSFSIAENVAASADYDADRVEDCIIRAGLGERLEHLEGGIETCLYRNFDEKGIEISGGEAQKFCLARALYKGAPFLVLDEPTAALDPISEHEIYTNFNRIARTKTAIYISHRLSSCRFCDEITVMENGRIAERGTHEELLAKKGVYYTLWNAQAEYYKDTAKELFEASYRP